MPLDKTNTVSASNIATQSGTKDRLELGGEARRSQRDALRPHAFAPILRITREARQYAVAELLSRAGVPARSLDEWVIRDTGCQTIVEIPGQSGRCISFVNASPTCLSNLVAGRFTTSYALWPDCDCHCDQSSHPRLIVPYVGEPCANDNRLFNVVDDRHIECLVDLPAAILLTLSRWEEQVPGDRDKHGRFMATSSVAWREKYLDRPIVDEYGVALEQALRQMLPNWPSHSRTLRVKISHDIDYIGLPFRWRNALKHAARYHIPANAARSVLSAFSPVETPELRAVKQVVLDATRYGLRSAVYWKASAAGPFDSGYDPQTSPVRRVIDWLSLRNVEAGVHPGYDTYHHPERLRREVQILRKVLGNRPLGGRQHYLRWCPDSWIDWENCGLGYDSSVGYSEQIGFRAGTCFPYRPWLISLNRRADLLEIPLLVMDQTLLGHMRLSEHDALKAVANIAERCRTVGGVLTILWHNNSIFDSQYRSLYLRLLTMLRGADNYEWMGDYECNQ